jgi:hypothetical protein
MQTYWFRLIVRFLRYLFHMFFNILKRDTSGQLGAFFVIFSIGVFLAVVRFLYKCLVNT